ncbi:hypothetical protein [Tengunoibacter tsumagoiensis]|uniref:DUF1611 domain-containing protein n=1 Tax=Tengunoibacter tsumagoiensis TaxID=2014871 RepID=A0A401ZX98_9CHLR|nr:hypothetical protein [Tengunoibacter tsumagoiensis]GCE11471.1 hypothetical protein KTT_13300 [Tengunoibacter tsumagoiensis]
MQQIQLSKIPSVVRSFDLPSSVEVSHQMLLEEGAVIVVEVLSDTGKNNLFEYTSGRIGFLVEGDIIPAVLGKRRALREYSGDIPSHLAVGDILYYLCESGVVGHIKGLNEEWGRPLQVRVLGALIQDGKQLNIKEKSIARKQQLPQSAPIIGVVGTCMNIGKTTAICKLIKHFKAQGLNVAGVKLSGVASTQDLDKIQDAGAYPVRGFMDGGLPSTCNDATEVVEVALGVLHEVNQSQPDLIIAEFGDGILGEYHVDKIIKSKEIQQHICAFIVGAGDLVGAWGATQIMQQYGVEVTVITGPAVNNDTGVLYVEQHMHVPAESNQHAMPKTIHLIEKNLAALKQTQPEPSESVA